MIFVRFARLLSFTTLGAVLLLPGNVLAQRQNAAQQACQNALHDAGARLSGKVGKQLAGCIEAAGSGEQTATTCLASDPNDAVAKAVEKIEKTSDKCDARPAFGSRNPALVADGYGGIFPITDIFGADVDAAIIDGMSDPAGAECQAAIAKSVAKIMKARLKTYGDCVKDGLASSKFLNLIAQTTCYDTDAKGKIAKAVAKAQKKLDAACAATPVATAAPGDCSGSSLSGLAACLDQRLSCAQCEGLGTADQAEGLCDLYDDAAVNGSCFFPSAPPESVAHLWDETLLEAIRRDTPRPTVHARNLFHLSIVMWDAWVAYNASGDPYLTTETPVIDDLESDLHEAISYGAYRLLDHRFASSVAAFTVQALIDYRMAVFGYDIAVTTQIGDTPAAVGNRLAQEMIDYGLADGANEDNAYVDTTGYMPVNDPMVVAEPGAEMNDPNRWQPLTLAVILAQNGTPLASNTQTALGSHWGNVAPFALTRALPTDVYQDPGPPPQLGGTGDAEIKQAVLEIVRYSSYLNGGDDTMIDVSPGARGNNSLGADDGTGHALNPVTSMPYESNMVRRSDWARITAEFWADGPASETPPGHWNTIANDVSSHPGFERRFGGEGAPLDELEWDVKLYLVLNGAVHDAAVAAWNAKRAYDTSRPISLVRYMGGKGQSSDPMGASYDPEGMLLEPGLVEVITPASTANGERHEHLAGHEGEIAILAWGGNPSNPNTQYSGAVWQLATEWIPYQLSTFVTPAFPGYVSGHSTFSRAAAEVMKKITGTEFFPEGLHEMTFDVDELINEAGPPVETTLQWATYYDAADDAGLSRRLGGIHVVPDDLNGREMGSAIGLDAWDLAVTYFDGTAVP